MTKIPRAVSRVAVSSVAVTAFAIASLMLISPLVGHGAPLQVMTWGGEHAKALQNEVLKPFTATSGILTRQNPPDVATNTALNLAADVVELGLHDAVNQCEDGSLLLLPIDQLPGMGATNKIVRDYVPNTLQPCAIGHSLWSTVVVYDPDRFASADRPALIADFFNTDYYPGARVVRKTPRVLAEWAMTASGVPAHDIYQSLENTDTSWLLIEHKINQIADDIVWVDNDPAAIELVRTGQAAFAMVGSESVVRDAIENRQALGVVWDAAVTEIAMWGIPANAANPQDSWAFLKYATSVNNTGKIASVFGYGPARYSTSRLVDRHLQRLLPSWPENQKNMVWGNSDWWQQQGRNINAKFAQWFTDIEDGRSLALANSENINDVGLNVFYNKESTSKPVLPFTAVTTATSTVLGKF